MTTEEIKATISMRDVLSRYGVTVGANGMCKCPIHGERHPSMKVYGDGYKCFACGSGGDIFRFVQDMEGCDFKEAFYILGGTYEKKNPQARAATLSKFERQRKTRQRTEYRDKQLRKAIKESIDICDFWIAFREPFSDDWCFAYNNKYLLEYAFESKYIREEKIREADVFRRCKSIRQRFDTF